jgi:hypothetical protein
VAVVPTVAGREPCPRTFSLPSGRFRWSAAVHGGSGFRWPGAGAPYPRRKATHQPPGPSSFLLPRARQRRQQLVVNPAKAAI